MERSFNQEKISAPDPAGTGNKTKKAAVPSPDQMLHQTATETKKRVRFYFARMNPDSNSRNYTSNAKSRSNLLPGLCPIKDRKSRHKKRRKVTGKSFQERQQGQQVAEAGDALAGAGGARAG